MEIQFSRIRDAENQTEKLRDFFEHYLGYNVSKDDITHIIDESHFWTHLLEGTVYCTTLSTIHVLVQCISYS